MPWPTAILFCYLVNQYEHRRGYSSQGSMNYSFKWGMLVGARIDGIFYFWNSGIIYHPLALWCTRNFLMEGIITHHNRKCLMRIDKWHWLRFRHHSMEDSSEFLFSCIEIWQHIWFPNVPLLIPCSWIQYFSWTFGELATCGVIWCHGFNWWLGSDMAYRHAP